MDEKKKPIWKRWWFWGIVVVVLIAIISLGGDNSTNAPTNSNAPQQNAKQEAPKNEPTMTKAEFDQLQSGMSYEEATEIIGGPGEVMSESGIPGDALHTIMYQYDGEGDIGANANLMFQGNKLNNKAQMGLK